MWVHVPEIQLFVGNVRVDKIPISLHYNTINSLHLSWFYNVPDTIPSNLHMLTLKEGGTLTIMLLADVRKLRQTGGESLAPGHSARRARAGIGLQAVWSWTVSSSPPLCLNEILPAECLAHTHAINVTYYFNFAFSHHFILTSMWERWLSKDVNYPRIATVRSRGNIRFFSEWE